MTNVLAIPEPLLGELSPDDADRLRAVARRQEFAPGDELWRQGTPATGCLVVVDGTAEVHRGGRRAGRLEPGAVAGAAAVLARKPHTTTVTAATNLTVWWIDGSDLDPLVVDAPTFGHAVVRRLARAGLRSLS